MAQGMRERLVTQRRGLKAAVERIGSGTFGLCCQCESEMEPGRLEADPAAVFCTECMMARENRGGDPGDR